jgi:hypothetical protein
MGAEVLLSSLMTHEPTQVRLDPSIFHQDWWLEVARKFPDYRELTVVQENQIVGRLPYVQWRNRFGLAFGHDPYWAHLGGPVVDRGLSASEQAKVICALIAQLPRRTTFSFICDTTLYCADIVRKAFLDAGFEHSTQITYLRLPGDRDVLDERKRKHRGHIKRAAKCLDCVDIAPCEFTEFFESNLKARGKESYAPLGMLPHILSEALMRGCGRVIAAKPNALASEGRSLPYDAAIAYIWDDRRCYYWLSTHRSVSEGDAGNKPHPDAVKLLMVNAMEHAQSMNLIFDADGVVSAGADHLYRSILGLRMEERRDVFRRASTLGRIYEKSRIKWMQRTPKYPTK